jgi:predicted ester cyclase
MGIPPTGKRVTFTGISITQFIDGEIVEHWAEFDLLGLLQQLGASLKSNPVEKN